jgi:hypothetical protein
VSIEPQYRLRFKLRHRLQLPGRPLLGLLATSLICACGLTRSPLPAFGCAFVSPRPRRVTHDARCRPRNARRLTPSDAWQGRSAETRAGLVAKVGRAIGGLMLGRTMSGLPVLFCRAGGMRRRTRRRRAWSRPLRCATIRDTRAARRGGRFERTPFARKHFCVVDPACPLVEST